jgi:crotonobetainyl-CoA:carnitine CoA-transferase CaiB-like acyl-CoA transferase
VTNKPLSGIRILDLTHMLSGPYCGMILADLGAETIKVEPLKGEGTRKLLATDPENSINGMGAYFITLNRNKQSVCIDLKTSKGLELFYDLVRKSDVVINNFGAGVPTRLKIDHAHLKQVNPRIISCSITGFGNDGPGFKRPAFDQVAQAMGGGCPLLVQMPISKCERVFLLVTWAAECLPLWAFKRHCWSERKVERGKTWTFLCWIAKYRY